MRKYYPILLAVAFTAATQYMSLAGYARWCHFLAFKVWL